MRGVTAGIVLVAATAISTGYFLESDFTAKAINELKANGVEMPIVSTFSSYNADQFMLSKLGNGTQYINIDKDATIRDLVTGETLKTIFKDVYSVAVNDDESLFIGLGNGGNFFYANKFYDSQVLEIDFDVLNLHGFIENTNMIVGTNYNELKLYDFDKKAQIFQVKIAGKWNNLVAVKNDIVVANGKNATIYDREGNYVDVLQFDSKITSVAYSPDGKKLLIGTENNNVQIFDVTSGYVTNVYSLFNDTKNAKNIVYDSSGSYLIIEKTDRNNDEYENLRFFSVENNQRIYTELDEQSINTYHGTALLSSNAKFIQFGKSTYNTKNIIKSPTGISFPTQYITMQAGTELKPELTATLLDGTTTTVTDGVTWKSDDLSVAYYDENKKVFKPTEEGTFTLRASYLDFTMDVEVMVEKPEPNEIEVYLAKHTKGGYYISSSGVKDIYLDQRIYNGSSYKGKNVVTTFTGMKNGKPVTYLDVARKANSAIKFKKIEIQANGKTLKKNTKSSLYNDGYEAANSIKLSTADRKWIKENIDVNKTVTAKLKGSKKTVTIKLTKTQKDALLKGVLVNEYLK